MTPARDLWRKRFCIRCCRDVDPTGGKRLPGDLFRCVGCAPEKIGTTKDTT